MASVGSQIFLISSFHGAKRLIYMKCVIKMMSEFSNNNNYNTNKRVVCPIYPSIFYQTKRAISIRAVWLLHITAISRL